MDEQMVQKLPYVTDGTAREQRLRRSATRQGLQLRKYRGPESAKVDTFMLVDADTKAIVATADHERGYGLSLDDIESELQSRA